MSIKRPRGLWNSQRSHRKTSEAIVTDLHIEHVAEAQVPESPATKKRRLSYTEKSPVPQRSYADVEEWEDVKELFANAVDKYEGEAPEEAVELFRQVIHESDHLLRLYPDPLTLLSTGHDSGSDGSSRIRSNTPSNRDPIRATDPLTTFHYVYGTSLLLLGKILEAYPALAKEVEPVGTPAFYLAALDVLEDGENASHSVSHHRFPKEDWRLAVSLGRTLVCLADEKLRRLSQSQSPNESSTQIMNFQDDLWPKDAAFGPTFTRRPPLTRRITLPPMTAHEIIIQATDHFSRAMLHMPHPRRHRKPSRPTTSDSFIEEDFLPSFSDAIDAPPTMPGLASRSRRLLRHIRPRILYTISNEILSVADRMPEAVDRECWAKWADDVFLQMETDDPNEEDWSHPIAVGRGRCWLIIGATRFEAIENQLESEDNALSSEDAESARMALERAVEYLERAQATRSIGNLELEDPFAADVSPMLGEAFVTLAALTVEGPKKDEYFARAAAEGVNIDEEDQPMDESHD